MVDEITKRLKSFNSLFDKYWYVKREFQYIDGIQRSMLYLFANDFDQSNTHDITHTQGLPTTDHYTFPAADHDYDPDHYHHHHQPEPLAVADATDPYGIAETTTPLSKPTGRTIDSAKRKVSAYDAPSSAEIGGNRRGEK